MLRSAMPSISLFPRSWENENLEPLTQETATSLLRGLQAGDWTAVDICEAFLDRAEALDPALHAFLRLDRTAVQDADAVDHRRDEGQSVGLLGGLPIAVKDIICTRGQPTTCASRMLEDFIPPYDADVIERLKTADAVILGKTNLDEFGMGSSTENSAFGPTRNPWNRDRVPGGSSGGSAAAVAARLVPWALGTDTGGSIRQPASFCGIVGLKPTYGRVSRFGLVAYASSLDQIGPLTLNVEDAALLLEAIAGHDPRDSTSVPRSVPAYSRTVGQPLDGLRLGIVRRHFGDGIDAEVAAAVEEALRVFQSQGAACVEVELPHAAYAIATYYIIAPCEASSNLARYDGVHYGHRVDEARIRQEFEEELAMARKSGGTGERVESELVRLYRNSRSEGFGLEVQRRILLGTYALSAGYYDAYYKKAQLVRRRIREDYLRTFQEVDFIIGPVAPTTAYALGTRTKDPLSMYLGDLYTVGTNLAGLPAIAIPCGFDQAGLPIGLQLQGRPFDEERLLRAAAMYERATDWHQRVPEIA